jgi:hypothetical protein
MGVRRNQQSQVIPPEIARDAEVLAAVEDHATAAAPHPGHMASNPTAIEFGLANSNFIDFHVGSEIIDFDVRIMATGGVEQNGRGDLSIQASRLDLVGDILLSINGGADLKRLLVGSYAINAPSVPAGTGGLWTTYLNLPGAMPGDIAIFCPTSNPSDNGLWAFAVHVCVTAADQVKLFLRNTYPTAVDLPSIEAKVVVLRF